MNNSEHDEMREQFKKEIVRHTNQSQALEQLHLASKTVTEGGVIVLAAPTGAGKTTVLREFCKEYVQERAPRLAAEPSYRPLCCCLAAASGHRAFDFKQLYCDGLIFYDDPFVNSRDHRKFFKLDAPLLIGEKASTGAVRFQLEKEFENHDCEFWIIDEAQHVLYGAKSGSAGSQCDILKSTGQRTKAGLILSGPPDLPNFVTHSAQLARRCEPIYIHRYRFDNVKDKRTLATVMHNILLKLPSHPEFPGVRENFELYYTGCLGCVGIFKDWIARAFAKMLNGGGRKIDEKILTETRHSVKALLRINNEIIEGENNFATDKAPLKDDVLSILLYGKIDGGSQGCRVSENGKDFENDRCPKREGSRGSPAKSGVRKVGHRAPGGDFVPQ